MSARGDARYGDQEWVTLAEFCGVREETIDAWRLGTSTPSVAVRDAACDWMIGRAVARPRRRRRLRR